MSTIQEQILSRLEVVLARVKDTDGRVYRSRQEVVTRAASPSIMFEPISCNMIEPYTTPHLVWNMTVRFTIISRPDEVGDAPEKAADLILNDMHSKILGDTTLETTLCISIYPRSISFQFQEGDNNAVAIICDYEFQFRTSLMDLSAVN